MQHRAGRAAVTAMLAAILGASVVPSSVPASAAQPRTIPAAAPASEGGPAFAPGRLLVRFDRGATATQKRNARAAVRSAKAKAIPGVSGLELVDTSLSVDQAVGRLRGAKGVRYAEPDYVIHADALPNDPLLPSQWALDQPSGVDINAPAAWTVTTGSPSIPVAVIDTGVQLDHPDLAANLWTNPGEIPGNGIDDDDDGYVDDVHGWDFVDDDAIPDDQNGHGTHVAGTIAAVGNNGTGVAGVAYSASIVPLRVLDSRGSGYISDGVRAIAYARAHGIRVANLSWTFTGAISQPLFDEIAAAGDAGLLITAAAGNDENDADQAPEYPAAYDLPSILSVAALAKDGTLASFSNHGLASVDIAAPGVSILSTWLHGGYAYDSGTSMAAPHVAGVAALVLAAHPGWTMAEVRDRILETAHPLAALAGLVGTGARLDAGAALAAVTDRAPSIQITSPAPGTRVQPGTSVTFTATATDPEDGDVSASITWHSSLMGDLGTGASLSRANLVMGTHLIVATAHDTAGHRRTATLVLRVAPPITFLDDHAEPGPGSLSLAPDGTPVLAWAEHGVGTVVSRFDGSAWTREVVSPSYADGAPDVLVEPSGTVDVAIQREWKNLSATYDGGILVAHDDGSGAGTGWAIDRVSEGCGDKAQGCGVDVSPSIARDASGRLHVAWARMPADPQVLGNDPGLWTAVSHASGAWTAEQVLDAEDVVGPDITTAGDGSTHIVFWRAGGPSDGLYHASDETGDWVIDEVAPMPDDGVIGAPSIQAGPAGRVDVAWAGSAGVQVRSRIAGVWQAPVTVAGAIGNDLDLVRDGTTLHLAYGLEDATGVASGVGYAVDDGSGWVAQTVDTGRDEGPRLAVDAGGHPHLLYLRSFPEHEMRLAALGAGGWTTDVADSGWTWTAPAIGVDAAGHHHVAVGRSGTQPGVWYATDATGTWTLQRLTQLPPDGPVALVAAPDGTVAIAWAESNAANGTPLADRAIRLMTGKPGAWTTRRIATDTGSPGVSLARGPTGRLYLAYSTRDTGHARIAVATNASGTWKASHATPGGSTTSDVEPSIAVDVHGHVHIAFEQRSGSNVAVRYVTNATGPWVGTVIAKGSVPRTQPSLGLTAAGAPRIAYRISGGGIRLAVRGGSAWSTKTISTSADDLSPALAIDTAGHAHLLWARAAANASCPAPFCAAAAGLRSWSDTPGFGAARRIADGADDGAPSIVRGADGSISGAFAAPGWHLGVVDLVPVHPSVTKPVVHLAASGTVADGRTRLTVTFAGRHAASYRLDQRVGAGGWQPVGAAAPTTSRTVSVPFSTTSARTFRVTPYDGLGVSGPAVAATAVVAFGHTETAGSGLVYAGGWGTGHTASYLGGAARVATSSTASVTWTVAAREVAWVASVGPTQGDARVYVDGTLVATIHLGAPVAASRQIVFRRSFANGTHRLMIKPVGNGAVSVDELLALR